MKLAALNGGLFCWPNVGRKEVSTVKTFVVTVKTKPHSEHNPRKKITGICPVFWTPCTDITGAHHSTLVQAETIEEAALVWIDAPNISITRIEEV